MKSPTKILTVNNDGKCEKIQLFPKLTNEFQITEIEFKSLNWRTITKEKEETETGDLVYYNEYGQSFQRILHISEIETFSRDKVVYKVIVLTTTRVYSDGTEAVESIQRDIYPDDSCFKIIRYQEVFTYNENHQISKVETSDIRINKDDVSYTISTTTKDLISSEIEDGKLIEKYKTVSISDRVNDTSEVFDKDYTPDVIRKEYITTDIFDNNSNHQTLHEIKNQNDEVVYSEKYTYIVDTNCHTSRMKQTISDKNSRISKVIYEDYDDESFDKLVLYQELINVDNFKGDINTINFQRKYSYDNDGDVLFIDQEKRKHSKTKISQQIFIY